MVAGMVNSLIEIYFVSFIFFSPPLFLYILKCDDSHFLHKEKNCFDMLLYFIAFFIIILLIFHSGSSYGFFKVKNISRKGYVVSVFPVGDQNSCLFAGAFVSKFLLISIDFNSDFVDNSSLGTISIQKGRGGIIL